MKPNRIKGLEQKEAPVLGLKKIDKGNKKGKDGGKNPQFLRVARL